MKIEIGYEIENAPAVAVRAELFSVWENVRNWNMQYYIFQDGEYPENDEWELVKEGLTWREAVKLVEWAESGFEKARITDSLGHCIVLKGFMADIWEEILLRTEFLGQIKVEFWNSYLKSWQTLAGSFFIDERNV